MAATINWTPYASQSLREIVDFLKIQRGTKFVKEFLSVLCIFTYTFDCTHMQIYVQIGVKWI